MEGVRIFDKQGKERDWTWVQATFGPVKIERTEVPAGVKQVFRLVGLLEREGPAVQVVGVSDAASKPLQGVRVVRQWPDAPALPDWPPPVSRWHARGVYGETNVNGSIGFGMGQGDYYSFTSGGVSSLWVADERGPSDLISGLGMVGGSAHRHLDLYFSLQSVATAQPPEPKEGTETPAGPISNLTTEQKWQLVLDRLDRIIDLLEDRVGR